MLEKYKKNLFNILDYAALFLYLYVIFSVFLQFFNSNHTEFWGFTALLVKLATLAIASLKILLSIKSNLRFSVISLFALTISFCYYFFQYHTDVHSYLYIGTELLDLTAMLIALYGINTNRLLKDYIAVRGTCFAIAVVAAFFNILPSNRNYISDRPGVWDMGLIHHNIPSIFFFFITIAWLIVVSKSKYRLVHYFFILSISIILSVVTTSRTSVFVIVLGIILYIIIYCSEKIDNKAIQALLSIFSKCALICPLLVFVVSIGGGIIWNYYESNNNVLKQSFIYNMISRFRALSEDFAVHGIPLPFKNIIQTASYNWFLGGQISTGYSDNTVHKLVIKYGILFTVVLYSFLQYWAIKAYKRQNYSDLVIISMLCIFSVMEPQGIDYTYNPLYCLITTTGICSEPVPIQNSNPISKKILLTLLCEGLVFIITTIYMIPIFKYQIETGQKHDYFLLWSMMIIILVLIATKLLWPEKNPRD